MSTKKSLKMTKTINSIKDVLELHIKTINYLLKSYFTETFTENFLIHKRNPHILATELFTTGGSL